MFWRRQRTHEVLAGIHRDLDEQMAQLAVPARRTSPYLISEESETPGEERELRKAVRARALGAASARSGKL